MRGGQNFTHGLSTTREGMKLYRAWWDARARCHDPTHANYERYGARGIRMQASWLQDVASFASYVRALPDFSLDMSLDRVDNEKGYVEGNLRWATPTTQVRNRRTQRNNSSGHPGLDFCTRGNATLVRFRWYEGDTVRIKYFSTREVGLLPAFKAAVEFSTNKH